jgi:hypothetical protein
MYYGYRCYSQEGQPLGWLYTYNNDSDLAFNTTNFDWCKRWKTQRGVAKNFDYYNRRWQFQSKGGYLKIEVMPEVTQTEVSKKSDDVIQEVQQETEQKNTIYQMNSQTKESQLGYFARQELIEKLTRRFAALNGYTIEPNTHILEAQHPRIGMWVAMAEVAIDEIEQELLLMNEQ